MSTSKTFRKFRLLGKKAFSIGNTLSDSLKLFYVSAIRPSLIHRGIGTNNPATKINFCLRLAGSRLNIGIRDNKLDIQTLLEIFGSDNLDPRLYCKTLPETIYDLGANIGISSIYLSISFPTSRVIAFEPEPGNYETARQNLNGVQNAQLMKRAIADKRGVMNFECGSDIRGGKLVESEAQDKGNIQNVDVWSIAEMIEVEGLPAPDYIKIDVEGAELAVLQGLGVHIQTVRVMQIETHSLDLHETCRSFLEQSGMKIVHEEKPGTFGLLWAIR